MTAGQLFRPRGIEDGAEIRKSFKADTEAERQLAYDWQRRVLGPEELAPWPVPTRSLGELQRSVSAWAAGIWAEYSPAFEPHGPYFHALPRITILADGPAEGFCASDMHQIRLHRAITSRAIVLHELLHSVVWWDSHGPDWRGASAWLWEKIFGIPRARPLAVAAEMGLTVNALMPQVPSLRTRFLGPCACCVPVTREAAASRPEQFSKRGSRV